jgi:Holliday junction resolvase-like predicted endonuclease
VDRHKQRKLIRTAALFVARYRRFGQSTMRFDVVGVSGDDNSEIDWIVDAFRPVDSSL